MTDFKTDVIARVQTFADARGIKATHVDHGSLKKGTFERRSGPTLLVRGVSSVDAAAESVILTHAALCAKTDLRYHLAHAEVEDRGGRKYLTLALYVEDTRQEKAFAKTADAAPLAKEKAAEKPAAVDGKGKP